MTAKLPPKWPLLGWVINPNLLKAQSENISLGYYPQTPLLSELSSFEIPKNYFTDYSNLHNSGKRLHSEWIQIDSTSEDLTKQGFPALFN